MTKEERAEYSLCYCGLCEKLQEKYGRAYGFMLTYDMTFLAMLLLSLYDPDAELKKKNCLPHPVKKHAYIDSDILEYAADMSVILTYYKLADDKKDDRSKAAGMLMHIVDKAFNKAAAEHKAKAEYVKQCLVELSDAEASDSVDPEQCADIFGKLLSSVFVLKNDRWQYDLAQIGYGLGRFIYIQDDFCDAEKDKRKCRKNLFNGNPDDREKAEIMLNDSMGICFEAFERLPLERNLSCMRSILTEGAWQGYELKISKNGLIKRNVERG